MNSSSDQEVQNKITFDRASKLSLKIAFIVTGILSLLIFIFLSFSNGGGGSVLIFYFIFFFIAIFFCLCWPFVFSLLELWAIIRHRESVSAWPLRLLFAIICFLVPTVIGLVFILRFIMPL
jgi:hypothetical protein